MNSQAKVVALRNTLPKPSIVSLVVISIYLNHQSGEVVVHQMAYMSNTEVHRQQRTDFDSWVVSQFRDFSSVRVTRDAGAPQIVVKEYSAVIGLLASIRASIK